MQRIRTRHWLCDRECVADVPDGYPLAEGLAVTCESCADTWWHYPVKGELQSGLAGGTAASPSRAAALPPSAPVAPAVVRTGSVHDVASGSPKELVVAPTMRREAPAPELRRRSERGADVYSPATLRSARDTNVVQRYAISVMALAALAAVVIWYVTSA